VQNTSPGLAMAIVTVIKNLFVLTLAPLDASLNKGEYYENYE
jgi:hypothetical protein